MPIAIPINCGEDRAREIADMDPLAALSFRWIVVGELLDADDGRCRPGHVVGRNAVAVPEVVPDQRVIAVVGWRRQQTSRVLLLILAVLFAALLGDQIAAPDDLGHPQLRGFKIQAPTAITMSKIEC